MFIERTPLKHNVYLLQGNDSRQSVNSYAHRAEPMDTPNHYDNSSPGSHKERSYRREYASTHNQGDGYNVYHTSNDPVEYMSVTSDSLNWKVCVFVKHIKY